MSPTLSRRLKALNFSLNIYHAVKDERFKSFYNIGTSDADASTTREDDVSDEKTYSNSQVFFSILIMVDDYLRKGSNSEAIELLLADNDDAV